MDSPPHLASGFPPIRVFREVITLPDNFPSKSCFFCALGTLYLSICISCSFSLPTILSHLASRRYHLVMFLSSVSRHSPNDSHSSRDLSCACIYRVLCAPTQTWYSKPARSCYGDEQVRVPWHLGVGPVTQQVLGACWCCCLL